MTSFELVATGVGLARVEGDKLLLLDLPYPDIGALLRSTGSLDPARTASVIREVALDEVDSDAGGLRSPLSSPVNVWGVGLNYKSKAATAGRDLPTQPILYLKPWNALAAPGEDLLVPEPRPAQLDHEAELVIVIGRTLHNASADEAWSAVAGITAGNDMSARDVMIETGNPTLAKGYPCFCPVGPSVAALADLNDGLDVTVRSWVNGELRQEGSTSDFIFPVSELLARLSHHTRLEPGDVLFTGTPPGTGADRGVFLDDGDIIRVRVDELLPLENRLGTAVGS